MLVLVTKVLVLRLDDDTLFGCLGAGTRGSTQNLVDISLLYKGHSVSIVRCSNGGCIHVLVSGRVYLIGVQGPDPARDHVKILGFAAFLVRRHRASKPSHGVTIRLFVLRITRFEVNVLRVQCIILLVLISFA